MKPTNCDYCQEKLKDQYTDGSIQGRWGNFHPSCFKQLGGKYGTGRGQRFDMATGKKLEG